MQAGLYYMWRRSLVEENKSDHKDAEGLIQIQHRCPGKMKGKGSFDSGNKFSTFLPLTV